MPCSPVRTPKRLLSSPGDANVHVLAQLRHGFPGLLPCPELSAVVQIAGDFYAPCLRRLAGIQTDVHQILPQRRSRRRTQTSTAGDWTRTGIDPLPGSLRADLALRRSPWNQSASSKMVPQSKSSRFASWMAEWARS